MFRAVRDPLLANRAILDGTIDDVQRRTIMDALGSAGSDYRWNFYQNGLSTAHDELSRADLQLFLEIVQAYIDHTLRANKRDDNLYHAYNTLQLSDDGARVDHLTIMLEGQVAILSSGMLAVGEAVELLTALRQSDLYRADQHSYMLYPNRELPGFLEKNQIAADDIRHSKLIAAMQQRSDRRLIIKDVNGDYHFQGNIRNANDVVAILATLEQDDVYREHVKAESQVILDLFERVFNHAAFTGRSGTFFAYEGLGSIYWHMVSKLLLAVQENVLQAVNSDADAETIEELIAVYEDVRAGIGFNKSPAEYGAFPTDPYSHSPMGQGAKQPGMTGMVKEEILTRLLELGIGVERGMITFNPAVFREQELLETPSTLQYIALDGQQRQLNIPSGALAFTFCQVPFIVQRGDQAAFSVHHVDGTSQVIHGSRLDADTSQRIFTRDGSVEHVIFAFT